MLKFCCPRRKRIEMDDTTFYNSHFSKLKHMSLRIIRYNWQNTPLEIALDALSQIESTWHCLVTASLQLVQQNEICENLCRAYDLFTKCKERIQHRINQITTAKCEVEKYKFQLPPDKMAPNQKIAPAAIPMVQIPLPIVIDLMRSNGSSAVRDDANIFVNDLPQAIVNANGAVCVRCSKQIKSVNFVKCTNCETTSHFGCLRKAKLLKAKANIPIWKCQSCLKCQCCTGTCKLVR